MTKKEYLLRLAGALHDLSKSERDKYLDYYSELIDDRIEEGLPEEEAVSQLESVYAAAERIKVESGIPAKKPLGAGAVIAIVLGAVALVALIALLYTAATRPPNEIIIPPPASESPAATQNPPEESPHQSQPVNSIVYMEQSFDADTVRVEIAAIENHVSILPSNDEDYHLHYYSTPEAALEFVEQNGAVSLKDPKYESWDTSLSVRPSHKNKENTIVLFVPEGGKLSLSLELISGAVEGEKISLGRVQIIGVAGSVEFENTKIDSLDVANVSGKLSIDESKIETIHFASTSSGLELDGVIADKIDFATVSGHAELEETSFNHMNIATVSGSLKGSLLGSASDYKVSFVSFSGNNSLGVSGSGPYKIDFNSVSGSILLDFDHD